MELEKIKINAVKQSVVIVNQGCGKFLFAVPYGASVKKGDRVLCETKRGVTDGVCATNTIFANDDLLEVLVSLSGAKLPLKPIVGKYVIENFND